jgi:predicted ATP-grasp superfamily ATP-dependent carboligase
MIDLARTFDRKPVLIPSADQFVSAMARHAQELESHFIFCHSTIGLQGMLATKQQQYELAAEHGMPVPRTRYVESEEEIREFASAARYPCLLKPLHCREWEPLVDGHPLRWQKVVTADSQEELLARYRMAAEINPRVVVQEMIEGPDTAKVVYQMSP